MLRQRTLRASLALGSLLTLACSGGGTTPSADSGHDPNRGEGVLLPDGSTFTRGAMLEQIAACIVRTQDSLAADARALRDATASAATDPSALPTAQAAWLRANATMQRLDVMQVGPLALATMPGGYDVRDELYAWPLFTPCVLDEAMIASPDPSAQVSRLNVAARGLAAIEYLLFEDSPGTSCPSTSTIVTDGSWTALDDEDRASRRAAYAAAIAADVATRADELVTRWSPSGGNFVAEVASPTTGRIFRSARLALNSISDALFYVEFATKDRKIGAPLGLRECATATCPDLVESRYAGRSVDNLRQNLHAFRDLYEGCGEAHAGLGFDDLLYAVGAEHVGVELREAIAGADAALAAIEEDDLAVALADDPASVQAAYDALKGITDLLRTQFLSVLDLELPTRVEGDND